MFHEAETDGKNPHVCISPTIELPSARVVSVTEYLSSYEYERLLITDARAELSEKLCVSPYGLDVAAPIFS